MEVAQRQKFEVKENVTPVFKPKRNVPFAALEPINKEFEQLEKLGAFSKVEYSNWVASPVYVKKEKSQNTLRFFNWLK